MTRFFFTLLLAMALPFGAQAQTYPAQPVQIVVPFPAGGPTDVLGRMLAQEFTTLMGRPFVVANKAGAAGNIGVDAVAKAAPDGYTLGVIPAGNVAVNPTLFSKLPYKASELQPVAMLATVENLLVVNASSPVKSLKDLLELARAKPGTLSFASPGAGSQAHLAGELMSLSSELRLLHVPYKGVAPAVNDLLGGQVTMMFGQMPTVLPHIKAGKLRALGIASARRSPALPDVPTIAEQGLPGFEAVSWYALMTPAGTPKNVADTLLAQTRAVLDRADTREKFGAMGMEPGTGGPQQLAATIESETVRWADVIRKKNIQVD